MYDFSTLLVFLLLATYFIVVLGFKNAMDFMNLTLDAIDSSRQFPKRLYLFISEVYLWSYPVYPVKLAKVPIPI
jgi:hypothetical protein